DRPAADEAAADDRRVGHAGLGLLRPEALGVGDAVGEAQRVLGAQPGEPLLEAVLVEQLADALAGRQAEVVVALGADVAAALGLLFEDGGLALRTLDPQPFRDATLRPAHGRHPPPTSGRWRVCLISTPSAGGVKGNCRFAATGGSAAASSAPSRRNGCHLSSICASDANFLPSTYA